MGWTYFADHNQRETRAAIIRREFEHAPTEKNPVGYGFEYITERGATVYAIMWRETVGAPRVYFGMVFMTKRAKGEFGYKDVSEDCGPYQYGAPLKMINMLDQLAPEPSGYALKWRAAVRERYAARRARPVLAVGARVILGDREYELLSERRSLYTGRAAGWNVVDVRTSGRYRMSAQQAARATLAPEKFPGMSDDEILEALAA
jgi:hypothetical protein